MDPLTKIIGGEPIEVRLLDGSCETVQVRQLVIRQIPAYMAVFQDEAATVELFCDKPKGWADQLSPESFEAVLAAGERLNLDFLARYATRQIARREKVVPGIQEKILAQALASISSSPASPPKPE